MKAKKTQVLYVAELKRLFVDYRFPVKELDGQECIVTFNRDWSLRIWYDYGTVDGRRKKFFHATAFMHAYHAPDVRGGFTVGDSYISNDYVDDYRLLADICEASRESEIRGVVDISIMFESFGDARRCFDLFLRSLRTIASVC